MNLFHVIIYWLINLVSMHALLSCKVHNTNYNARYRVLFYWLFTKLIIDKLTSQIVSLCIHILLSLFKSISGLITLHICTISHIRKFPHSNAYPCIILSKSEKEIWIRIWRGGIRFVRFVFIIADSSTLPIYLHISQETFWGSTKFYTKSNVQLSCHSLTTWSCVRRRCYPPWRVMVRGWHNPLPPTLESRR